MSTKEPEEAAGNPPPGSPVKEILFSNIRRHMLGQAPADEQPIKAWCQICHSAMSVANIVGGDNDSNEDGDDANDGDDNDGDDNNNKICAVLPCGHVACEECMNMILDRAKELGVSPRCPYCQLKLDCKQCGRHIALCLAPKQGELAELVSQAVPLTSSEKGPEHKNLCFECQSHKTWMRTMMTRPDYPGLRGINMGFKTYVYHITRWLEIYREPYDEAYEATKAVFRATLEDFFSGPRDVREDLQHEPGFHTYLLGVTGSRELSEIQRGDTDMIVVGFKRRMEQHFEDMMRVRLSYESQYLQRRGYVRYFMEDRHWWSTTEED